MMDCRSCKAPGDSSFESIFDTGLENIYQDLVQVQVLPDSPYILFCSKCIRFLQKLKEFRTQCIESNKYFVKLEQNDEIAIDIQILEEDIKIKVEPLESIVCYSDDIKDEEIEKKKKAKQKKISKIDSQAKEDDNSNDGSIALPPLPEILICPICSKSFNHKYRLNDHKRVHEEGKFICHFCNKKFQRKSQVLSHLIAHHVENDFGRTGDYACDICSKRYVNETRLACHKRRHFIKLTPCPICAKMVKNMNTHIKTHETNTERFQCDKCDKNYKFKKDLHQHLIEHENKIFACTLCGREFNRPSKLQQHMRIHKPDRPTFPCNHCNHHYTTKSAFREHLRQLKAERKFICTICSFAFKKAHKLKNHMRTHNGTKPYMCSQCDYGSIRKKEFLEHVRLQHEQEDESKNEIELIKFYRKTQ